MGQSVIISQTFASLIPPTASGGPLPFTKPRAAMGFQGNSLPDNTGTLSGAFSSVISSEAEKSFSLDLGVVFDVQTFYEKMFLEMGLPITYLAFCIDHDGPYAFPGEAFDHDRWLEAEGPRRSFSHQPNKKG